MAALDRVFAGSRANLAVPFLDGSVLRALRTRRSWGRRSQPGTDGGIPVNPAAASQFIIAGPSSVNASIPFSLTVTVEDAYGNVVIGYTGTVHFTSKDRTATLPADYTFTTADKGVHTFTGLVLRKKGTQKVTLSDTLNRSITGSVTENVL